MVGLAERTNVAVTDPPDSVLGCRQMNSHRIGSGRIRIRGSAAAFVLLVITFLLLVPDPHDHGDAGSLGGLFRLLLPGSTPIPGAPEAGGKPRPGPQDLCPIHFWQQVASTGLFLALLLRFFLNAEARPFPLILLPSATSLQSFHNRAPPILL